jgi:hypothetical protein
MANKQYQILCKTQIPAIMAHIVVKSRKNRLFRQKAMACAGHIKKNIDKLLHGNKIFMYFGNDFRKTYSNYEKNFHSHYYCFSFYVRE